MARFVVMTVCLMLGFGFGCAERTEAREEPGQCHQSEKWLHIDNNREVDILFVIDTSSSMADEQENLLANYSRFISVIESFEGGLPNTHIGVVSADLGAGDHGVAGCSGTGGAGALQATARQTGCTPPAGAYISDVPRVDGTRERNYTGNLRDTFLCIADLGTQGCDIPQPLEAMRRALDGSNPANDGFLREEALLMVVFVTDADDCSTSDPAVFDPGETSLGPATEFRCFEHGVVCTPDEPRTAGDKHGCVPRTSSTLMANVDTYAQFLKGLKSDPYMVTVSAITGGTTPISVSTDGVGAETLDSSCTSSAGEATPSPRLGYFLDQFPQRNGRASVCDEDQTDAFWILASSFRQLLSAPCVDGAIDLDPETEGIQHECVLSDMTYEGDTLVGEVLIPQCPPGGPKIGGLPCWEITVDTNICSDTETGALLDVTRSDARVPPETHSVLRCLGQCELEAP